MGHRERHRQLFGVIFTSGSVPVAEIISSSGFDWVMIDMEHSCLSLEQVQNVLPVFGSRVLKIVRVPVNDDTWIKRVLDTGCDGIMVPMVKTAGEACRLVQSAMYPPEGQRSVGLTRAHGYGASFKEYLSSANGGLIIMAQVEHADAVRNIDEILAVKGLSAIFIGPYDLSASMGIPGQVKHPDVQKAISAVREACDKVSIPCGIFGADPAALEGYIKDGYEYILCGVDVSLISGMMRDLGHKLRNSN